MSIFTRFTTLCCALIITIISLMGLTAFADASAESTPDTPIIETPITEGSSSTIDVNIRLVMRSAMSYAACTVYIEKYASETSTVAIWDTNIGVQRINNWEEIVPLEPGFYEVTFVSVTGDWSLAISGASERFEVKGDKMTVYVAVDNAEKPADMPDNWLVYGEDTQNFYIWANDEETESPDGTGAPPVTTDAPSGEPLPSVSTDIETGEAPNRPTKPNTNDNDIPEEPETPPKQSVVIGNYIYMFLVGGLLIVSVILLFRVQKQRGA